MKLFVAGLVVLLVFFAGCVFGASFRPLHKTYVLTDDLKLEDATYFFRDSPPTKAPVVGTLRKGQEIIVFRKGGAAYLTMHTVIQAGSLTAVAHEK